MLAGNQRSSTIRISRDAERELGFGFSSQKADLVPIVPRIRFPVKRGSLCKAMNSKDKKRLSPTRTREERLVWYQARIALFLELLKL
jgi:hypothetical protein